LFAFFGIFFVFLAVINIHDIQIQYHFLTFFGVLASGALRWPVDPFQPSFVPWLKPLVTPLIGWKRNCVLVLPFLF